MKNQIVHVLGGGALAAAAVVGCSGDLGEDPSAKPGAAGLQVSSESRLAFEPHALPNGFPFLNPAGLASTYSTTGGDVDLTGEFFTSLGTNGRTCGTCHLPSDGWTVIPSHIQERFEHTGGTDAIFRTVDGSNSPNADVSTVDARRKAYTMLLTKGLIRIGVGVPLGAEYDLVSVDDPYGYASASELSLFRRPLPTANLRFLSTVMWDGRETLVDTNSPPLPGSNCLKPPFALKCFYPVAPNDLGHQANDATLTHAQAMVPGLTAAAQAAIVSFETTLTFAQAVDFNAGPLWVGGAAGGPEAISTFAAHFGINDNFGDYETGAPFTATIFTLYDAWSSSHESARAQVARGEVLFNSKPITISGVAGLNGSLGLPASFAGSCGTCHDAPQAGNHSVPAPLDIGVASASQRTPDMPLYTLACNATGIANGHCTAGQSVQITDPGRALITGNFADIGKFKGPTLRGVAARAPYFHNGMAANLDAVVDFYNTRFDIGFTEQEHEDLVAFLQTL
jgi:hypothetical protein